MGSSRVRAIISLSTNWRRFKPAKAANLSPRQVIPEEDPLAVAAAFDPADQATSAFSPVLCLSTYQFLPLGSSSPTDTTYASGLRVAATLRGLQLMLHPVKTHLLYVWRSL